MRVVFLAAVCAALAYGEEPSASHTSNEWLIWALSSGAPEFLRADITVAYPTTKDGKMEMKVLKKGSNGWTCVPGFPGPPKDLEKGWENRHELSPFCGDEAAFGWVDAYFKKETPKIDRDGWAWMLHGDQGEDNEEAGHVGDLKWMKGHKKTWIQSGPHLMVMPKDPDLKLTTDFNVGSPYTMFEGTEYAHIMIPANQYYEYQEQVGSSPTPKEPEGPHTSKEWLIWALSQAAPPYMAGNVTVGLPGMKDGEMTMEILKKGTNGWTCVPGQPKGPKDLKNGWKDPHEAMAICGDKPAFQWAAAYFAGKTPEIESDGWMWMLMGDQGEDNTEPGHLGDLEWKHAHKETWIESGPHLMVMPKNPDLLLPTDFNIGGPYTMFAGTKYAHVMIPYPDYYHYQPQKKTDKDSRLFSITGYFNFEKTTPTATISMALFCIAALFLVVGVVRRGLTNKARSMPVDQDDDEERHSVCHSARDVRREDLRREEYGSE